MATEVDEGFPRRKRQKKKTFHSHDGKRDLEQKTAAVELNWNDSKTRILVDVHPLVYERLCELRKTGLYGFSPADCAERLIAEQLRWILRQP